VSDNFFDEQAKRLYGLGELEAEALEVLRLVVRQTERGENSDPLDEIRRFIEETDIDVIGDEMRTLVEREWPW
jgi:hypothetical protein